MPGGDRTGPFGLGPMTGRRLGYCAGYNAPGFTIPRYGRGFGRGLGRGFGRGRGFWWRFNRDPIYFPYQYDIGVNPQINRDEEKVYLEDMIKSLEEELRLTKKRLQELSSEKKEDSQ